MRRSRMLPQRLSPVLSNYWQTRNMPWQEAASYILDHSPLVRPGFRPDVGPLQGIVPSLYPRPAIRCSFEHLSPSFGSTSLALMRWCITINTERRQWTGSATSLMINDVDLWLDNPSFSLIYRGSPSSLRSECIYIHIDLSIWCPPWPRMKPFWGFMLHLNLYPAAPWLCSYVC